MPLAKRTAAGWVDRLLARSPIRSLRAGTSFERLSRRNRRLSDEFMERIRSDADFHRALV
jgi:hypothetical protein